MGLRGKSGKGVVVRHRGDKPPAETKQEATLPDAPETLSDGAKSYWETLSKQLIEAEMLAGIDLAAFALLCSSLDEVDRCEAVLRKEGFTVLATNKSGHTNVTRHPVVSVRNTARTVAVQLLSKFGMCPGVRGLRGVTPPAVGGDSEEAENDRVRRILERKFFE
ncbi:MAG: P27 family phage terminase small subunit [Planctomycetaceae bacterium]|nr:P27 family phage terminase small subunit [Planctomycetaceae bacterium]